MDRSVYTGFSLNVDDKSSRTDFCLNVDDKLSDTDLYLNRHYNLIYIADILNSKYYQDEDLSIDQYTKKCNI